MLRYTTSMATTFLAVPRTGDPLVDCAVEDFLARCDCSWLLDGDQAAGMCGDVSEQFHEFVEHDAFIACAAPEHFGYEEDPEDEWRCLHEVVVIEGIGCDWLVDFTASQYGVVGLPVIMRSTRRVSKDEYGWHDSGHRWPSDCPWVRLDA